MFGGATPSPKSQQGLRTHLTSSRISSSTRALTSCVMPFAHWSPFHTAFGSGVPAATSGHKFTA